MVVLFDAHLYYSIFIPLHYIHVRGNDDELEDFFLEVLSPKAMGEKWTGQLLEAYRESESVIISAETKNKSCECKQ